ncbi:hypothetical protein [Methanospirillum sp.]|uniref:hypothetical protein n=1 Tax=Methanospirillum sp. TaxID=45200 RepID=UPI0035A1C0F7
MNDRTISLNISHDGLDDLSKNTILRRINKLEKLGLVEKKGSGPGTRYVIRS